MSEVTCRFLWEKSRACLRFKNGRQLLYSPCACLIKHDASKRGSSIKPWFKIKLSGPATVDPRLQKRIVTCPCRHSASLRPISNLTGGWANLRAGLHSARRTEPVPSSPEFDSKQEQWQSSIIMGALVNYCAEGIVERGMATNAV
jgi:hypothetical protein